MSVDVRDQIDTIIVNNDIANFQPNSPEIDPGTGEKKAEAFARGEGQVELVVAIDNATRIGRVKFSMANTQQSREQAISWSKSLTNLIKVVYQSGKVYLFENMVLNSPKLPGGSEANIELEFMGGAAN